MIDSEKKYITAHHTANAVPSPFSTIEEINFEMEWIFPAPLSLVMSGGGNPEPHLCTSVQCYWNSHSLFVLFSGAFKKLRMMSSSSDQNAPIKTRRLWEQSDVFELFIGAHAREKFRYKEFQVAPDGRWIDIAVDRAIDPDRGDYSWISGCTVRSSVDYEERLWKSAIAIPWEALEPEGNIFRDWECNFFRASGSYHGEELLAWSPPGTGNKCFHRIEHFGILRLLK